MAQPPPRFQILSYPPTRIISTSDALQIIIGRESVVHHSVVFLRTDVGAKLATRTLHACQPRLHDPRSVVNHYGLIRDVILLRHLRFSFLLNDACSLDDQRITARLMWYKQAIDRQRILPKVQTDLLLSGLLGSLLSGLLRRLLLLLLLSLHLGDLLHNLLLLDQERTENATRYSHSPSLPIVQALVAEVTTVGTSHSALAVRELAQSTDARTRNLPVIHRKRDSYTSKSLLAASTLHGAHSLLVVVHGESGT